METLLHGDTATKEKFEFLTRFLIISFFQELQTLLRLLLVEESVTAIGVSATTIHKLSH